MTSGVEVKPKLKLTGGEGNAFFILGRAKEISRKAGWGQMKWDQFYLEATAGDYDMLLQACMKYFDVS